MNKMVEELEKLIDRHVPKDKRCNAIGSLYAIVKRNTYQISARTVVTAREHSKMDKEKLDRRVDMELLNMLVAEISKADNFVEKVVTRDINHDHGYKRRIYLIK